ncbi:hypothetical protein [uncultured Tateyamaria sp.]|uniref:hypothetical protein n=1 Tax=Tateyamaria sp. 1078 TaxID=3417464 RepID=UPI00262DB0C9|nr:hypothetical protein [uncultured Tateyamaria sp.]
MFKATRGFVGKPNDSGNRKRYEVGDTVDAADVADGKTLQCVEEVADDVAKPSGNKPAKAG